MVIPSLHWMATTRFAFSTPGKNSVAIGAQTINSDNSPKWPVTIPVTDAYLKWNLWWLPGIDDAAGCNAISGPGLMAIFTSEYLDEDLRLYYRLKQGTLESRNGGIAEQEENNVEGFNQSAGDLILNMVQRSSNARDFTNIGTVAAKVPDNHYTWWDKQPLKTVIATTGIKLSGISGNNEYSNIIKTTVGAQPP